LGRPSGKRSPFHSGVMAFTWSGVKVTFWAPAGKAKHDNSRKRKIFLFIWLIEIFV
jgi:hypothetical protein